MLDPLVDWQSFIIALLVFGFAPGALLRLIVLAFPRDDPRRSELLAELHAVPRLERPFWVLDQLEVALFEGLAGRIKSLVKHQLRGAFVAFGRDFAAFCFDFGVFVVGLPRLIYDTFFERKGRL